LICVNASPWRLGQSVLQVVSNPGHPGAKDMTQHILPEHTIEDRRTMRRLAVVIGGFLAFTAAMALGVGITLG